MYNLNHTEVALTQNFKVNWPERHISVTLGGIHQFSGESHLSQLLKSMT
jgi:hypothetical protein